MTEEARQGKPWGSRGPRFFEGSREKQGRGNVASKGLYWLSPSFKGTGVSWEKEGGQ